MIDNSNNNDDDDDISDSSCPGLATDSSDDDWVEQNLSRYDLDEEYYQMNVMQDQIEKKEDNENSLDKETILNDNNFEYKIDSKKKVDNVTIGYVEDYPPNLDANYTITACKPESTTATNLLITSNIVNNPGNNVFQNYKEVIIPSNEDPTIPTVLFSHARYAIKDGNCIISTISNILADDEYIEDIYYKNKNVKYIKSKNIQWYIHVPIQFQDGTTRKMRIFADPGANSACVKSEWAIDHFPDMINRIKIRKVMDTPGGIIAPKYCMWMSFPAKETLLKAKMHLVNKLPVDVLADINMLKAFGYEFKEETPEIFAKQETKDLDMELCDHDDILANRKNNSNWFNCVTQTKLKAIQTADSHNKDVKVYDMVIAGDEILYDFQDEIINKIKHPIKTEEEIFQTADYKYEEDKLNEVMVNLVRRKNRNEILNWNKIDKNKDIDLLKNNRNNVMGAIKDLNTNNPNNSTCKIYHKCLFLMPRNAFLATDEEIRRAQAIFVNERLSFPNLEYLKHYPAKYGPQFNGVYEMAIQWLKENKRIFATHTFSRRTMKTEYGRLGIKLENRDKIMFAPQYPISATKRIHMINWVLINEKNGFHYRIPQSQHSTPYLMVPKRNKQGVITRYRPAFDGRLVNQYCELMQCTMPTLTDFRNLHQLRGLTTMLDIKNYFDCIPLHPLDRKYAVCHTPLGFYMMRCMTYGWMNSAPEGQKRTNRYALHIGNCLAYIDDLQVKHLLAEGTQGVKRTLYRISDYAIRKNIQLNPKKFFIAFDESEGFGFKYSIIGETVSNAYQRKMLAIAKPDTISDVRTLVGVLNYMNHHIYECKRLLYWITNLEEVTDMHTKKKRLKWTREANIAWEKIRYLIQHLPLLHHPTREGKFCIVVDACNYGLGAALWQLQKDLKTDAFNWVLCDLWSKILPKQLRHCHSMVHEAYGVTSAMEHWQFYLICRKFIVSTDNMPVANIFGELWKELSPMTHKQLLRLRTRVSSFCFNSYHVKGINNHIADGLSRFTMELVQADEQLPIEQRKFPLRLEVINSDDTNTPPLTKEERKTMKLALLEDERLKAKLKQLKKEKIHYQIDSMVNVINLEPKQIKTFSKLDDFGRSKASYESFCSNTDSSWNNMMQQYKHNCDYKERKKINSLLYFKKDILVRRDDFYFSKEENDQYHSSVMSILLNLENVENERCCILEKQFSDENWKHLIEMKTVSECLCNEEKIDVEMSQVNAVDEEYVLREDKDYNEEEMKQIQERQQEIVTRSRERRRKEKERQDRDDDDTLEDELEFTKLNVEFNNITEQMESHEDFMYEIFGHRIDMDIMNFKNFRHMQESDNIIALAIKLFKSNRKDWKQEDLDLIKQWEFGLYYKLIKNKLSIQNNILHVRDYDPILKEQVNKIVIPFNLRGKLMDYAHHNLLQHHFSFDLTYNTLVQRYWWYNMKRDVRHFCKHCISCQFVKGGLRHRAPLAVRKQPKPREHLFADFLGPIYGRYYILVLVDYATGFTMLIPTVGCDALTVAHAIINNWIRIFGYFRIFESDWGSGFNNQLMDYLSKIADFKHELAEPRNHRSIGKVERVIGFLQNVINHYNLLLDKQLTDNIDNLRIAWNKIKVIIPFTQLAFNQRIMRISGISPNMAIFGTNMNDAMDISRLSHQVKLSRDDPNIKPREYEFLRDIEDTIKKMENISKSNWIKHTYLSAKTYNNRWNITPAKVANNLKRFKVGSKILYFIGDKQVARGKWREKWTGPWIINKHLNKTSLIIADPDNGNEKRVTFDRVKLFNEQDFVAYEDIIKHDESYKQYQRNLLKTLSNYNVKLRKPEVELDYTKSN